MVSDRTFELTLWYSSVVFGVFSGKLSWFLVLRLYFVKKCGVW